MRCRALLIFTLALILILPSTSSFAKTKKCQHTKKKVCYTTQKKAKQTASVKKYRKKAKKYNKKRLRKASRKYRRQYYSAFTARSAIVLDADTNDIYFAKDPYLPLQPASTIKIVTGLLALKNLDENDPVRVSHYAQTAPPQKAYLRCGEVYPAIDLIYATLLHSANDASRALAEKIAGSEEEFAQIMTQTVHALGAKNTVCRTSSGLTAPGQCTTAYDLAVIFKKAMQDEKFSNILKTRKFEIHGGKFVVNHNKALWQVEGAEGGKTGFTRAAQRTYVGMFKRNNRTIVIAFLGSENLWSDVRYLVRKAFTDVRPTIQAAKTKRDVSSI
ncbi:MAG TPA: D-alanyl-D-alanine carboxypeptidase [Proteobacteria bacterium]|nr:D-alanyl-D-alanine carboxypeptidase [Pseudomonadota bacterium]